MPPSARLTTNPVRALVFDPLHDNPGFRSQCYEVSLDRLTGAIMLGAITYDSNLLILEPPTPPGARTAAPVP